MEKTTKIIDFLYQTWYPGFDKVISMKKIIDLFAGAGGLSEGFRRNNFDIIAHVEMDKDAAYTLKTREAYYYCKKKKLNYYDQYLNKQITREELYLKIPKKILNRVINKEISKDTIENIFEEIDSKIKHGQIFGIIGGPPCQAYSVVGRSRKKDMENDPRNFLYKYYLKFIEKYKPIFYVFENVQGIFSAKNGTVFKDIEKEMNKLGYTFEYRLLNSKDFGVVQDRKRVIIIGYKKELNLHYPNFEKVKFNFNIKDLFEDLPVLNDGQTNNKYIKETTACLKKLKIRDKKWDILTYNETRKINSNDKEIYKICIKNNNIKYKDLPENLIKHSNKNSFADRFKVVDYYKPCQTMVAHIAKDGHHYIHPDIKQCRSITVREAARIQSFPDDYYFESSRTSAFRQIGNAVPVLMAEKIAKKIEESLM